MVNHLFIEEGGSAHHHEPQRSAALPVSPMMERMTARVRALFAVLVALAAAGFLSWQTWRVASPTPLPVIPPASSPLPSPTPHPSPETAEELLPLVPAEPELSTPGPLLRPPVARETELTQAGILRWTNRERTRAGLRPLTEQRELTAAAERKLQDMFAKQYFAHRNPDGEGIAAVVTALGYVPLRVGENLALGNFGNDEELVAAWMASPGHRANIVSPGFSEIGIAAKEGDFQDRRTWLAVQVFALPASACPAPSTGLRSAITARQTVLEDRDRALADARRQVEERQAELIALAAEIERLVAEGNEQITAGNAEIEEGNRIARETGDTSAAELHWKRGEELQQAGRALHEQARVKQEGYAERHGALEARVEEVNRAIEDFRRLHEEFQRMVDDYNEGVRALDACVGKFRGEG